MKGLRLWSPQWPQHHGRSLLKCPKETKGLLPALNNGVGLILSKNVPLLDRMGFLEKEVKVMYPFYGEFHKLISQI